MYDVACVGMLVADVFAKPLERLPTPGELATTSELVISVGGGAANTAIALGVLGHKAKVAGKVGADILGDFVISELKRHQVGVEHIRQTSNLATSGTMIFKVHGEDRRYLHCIGANADFGPEDIDFGLFENIRILYVGGYLAMPLLTPENLSGIFQVAKAKGLTTILDVVMPAGSPAGIEHVAPVLRYTDYFLPNQEEAGRLTGLQDEWSQAECLNASNPDCAVVITRGASGAVTKWRDRFIETPPFKMETVDESGAGDAFAAGLITGLLKNWELERALLLGAAVGASCTRALGCSAGVFTFEDAFSFLNGQAAWAPEARNNLSRALAEHTSAKGHPG